ncbi:MAG: phosphoenolpyruvate synthase [Candidatus Levybacteria bacterium RIFCSPLOWO2_01_FULL_39_10]|nr:MAG: phosphoenolpyruvate synthase [Candidatus Levybacteria bacterium RIFCSPLOWO2_01_FULL_39_10]
MPKNVVWFSEVDKEDIALVGGKGANLGEMAKSGFPVPDGFIVTAYAYFNFIKSNGIDKKVSNLISTINFNDSNSLKQVSVHIKKEIMDAPFPNDLKLEIYNFYKKLGGTFREPLVAVRSSATAEDLPGASFAGQQETYLNVKGDTNLILSVKKCWASLFEERAIFYRHENKFDHVKVGIAVPVQEMVESDSSGVMFTIDPVTNDKTKIVIEAIWGLGELIVQGKVTPDHFEVSKDNGKIEFKQINQQKIKLVKKGGENKEVSVGIFKQKNQKITDQEILKLFEEGKKLEKHYFFPQDIEWAIEKGKVYIIQTRPITTMGEKDTKSQKISTSSLGTPILKGDGASFGIVTGHVRILKSPGQISTLVKDEILVAPQTNPDFVPAMKIASAIVTDFGGRTSHAAIVSREIGIPAVVGTEKATTILKNGDVVTVNGETGEVFKGGKSSTNEATTSDTEYNKDYLEIETATKVYVNLAEPEFANKQPGRSADGIGLLRAEFMIAGIGVHPKKMIRDGKKHEYIQKLADNLEIFCNAFNSKPVVYRATDFKTNEYRNLTGGREFEPQEPNPMLGFRGAYRYISDKDVFKLELSAIKEVRNKRGCDNLWLMLPFVRTPKELELVKKIITDEGLIRSQSFKLWMMVEIPSNVILLDDFIDVGIDGVSIGTNDLTMLILGTDRDNSEVATEFNERNKAVLLSIEKVIKTAKKRGITSSICGQAASYSEIMEVAIRCGVTSLSVSSDLVPITRKHVSDLEKKLFS